MAIIVKLFGLFLVVLFLAELTWGRPMLGNAEFGKKDVDLWANSMKFWNVPEDAFPYFKKPVKQVDSWGNPSEFWNVPDLGLF